jgi:putative protein-disulfide isomerase
MAQKYLKMLLKDVREQRPDNNEKPGKGVGMEVIFYTDPLCCWSWAMQSQWKQFQGELKGSFNLNYKMAGLLPSWNHFNDEINSIRKPVQMGPEWMHARAVSGAQINDRIWITDPPASSFPACIAVKCAALQSPEFGAGYLFLVQEAVMLKNMNISKTEVLLKLAEGFSRSRHNFNLFKFREDLLGEAGREAFRKDLQECKYLGIVRLPTILFKSAGGYSVVLSGYQSYESLRETWIKLAKDI